MYMSARVKNRRSAWAFASKIADAQERTRQKLAIYMSVRVRYRRYPFFLKVGHLRVRVGEEGGGGVGHLDAAHTTPCGLAMFYHTRAMVADEVIQRSQFRLWNSWVKINFSWGGRRKKNGKEKRERERGVKRRKIKTKEVNGMMKSNHSYHTIF